MTPILMGNAKIAVTPVGARLHCGQRGSAVSPALRLSRAHWTPLQSVQTRCRVSPKDRAIV